MAAINAFGMSIYDIPSSSSSEDDSQEYSLPTEKDISEFPWQCSKCGKQYSYFDSAKSHYWKMHDPKRQDSDDVIIKLDPNAMKRPLQKRLRQLRESKTDLSHDSATPDAQDISNRGMIEPTFNLQTTHPSSVQPQMAATAPTYPPLPQLDFGDSSFAGDIDNTFLSFDNPNVLDTTQADFGSVPAAKASTTPSQNTHGINNIFSSSQNALRNNRRQGDILTPSRNTSGQDKNFNPLEDLSGQANYIDPFLYLDDEYQTNPSMDHSDQLSCPQLSELDSIGEAQTGVEQSIQTPSAFGQQGRPRTSVSDAWSQTEDSYPPLRLQSQTPLLSRARDAAYERNILQTFGWSSSSLPRRQSFNTSAGSSSMIGAAGTAGLRGMPTPGNMPQLGGMPRLGNMQGTGGMPTLGSTVSQDAISPFGNLSQLGAMRALGGTRALSNLPGLGNLPLLGNLPPLSNLTPLGTIPTAGDTLTRGRTLSHGAMGSGNKEKRRSTSHDSHHNKTTPAPAMKRKSHTPHSARELTPYVKDGQSYRKEGSKRERWDILTSKWVPDPDRNRRRSRRTNDANRASDEAAPKSV